jgi:hypothetical protein
MYRWSVCSHQPTHCVPHTHTHTYIHTLRSTHTHKHYFLHTHIHINTTSYTHTHTLLPTHTHIHYFLHTHTYTTSYTHIHTLEKCLRYRRAKDITTSLSTCVCVCVYECVCVQINALYCIPFSYRHPCTQTHTLSLTCEACVTVRPVSENTVSVCMPIWSSGNTLSPVFIHIYRCRVHMPCTLVQVGRKTIACDESTTYRHEVDGWFAQCLEHINTHTHTYTHTYIYIYIFTLYIHTYIHTHLSWSGSSIRLVTAAAYVCCCCLCCGPAGDPSTGLPEGVV